MIKKHTQLKAGGRVKISGIWFRIKRGDYGMDYVQAGDTSLTVETIGEIIEAYDPPVVKPEPFAYIEAIQFGIGEETRLEMNEAMCKRLGDPTIYTYANAPAEDFGLVRTSDVLLWQLNAIGGDAGRWVETEFRHLEQGDLWRRQPAAPKGVAS